MLYFSYNLGVFTSCWSQVHHSTVEFEEERQAKDSNVEFATWLGMVTIPNPRDVRDDLAELCFACSYL